VLTLLMPTGSSFDDSLSSYDLSTLYRLAIDSTVESSVGSSMREVGQQQYSRLLVVECGFIEPAKRAIPISAHHREPCWGAFYSLCDLSIRGQPVAAPFDQNLKLGRCGSPLLEYGDEGIGLRQLNRGCGLGSCRQCCHTSILPQASRACEGHHTTPEEDCMYPRLNA